MKQSKFLTALAAGALVFSQGALADKGGDNWSISGWINEAVTYYDYADNSDLVQSADNGTTLGSRITLAGQADLANSGLAAGFEVILEPSNRGSVLGFGAYNYPDSPNNPLDDESRAHDIGVLGNSLFVSGGFGKLTVGLQSMPTDNIAVLEDPSLTLWSSISPIFRGNSVQLNNYSSTQIATGFNGAFTATADAGAFTAAQTALVTAIGNVDETLRTPLLNTAFDTTTTADNALYVDLINGLNDDQRAALALSIDAAVQYVDPGASNAAVVPGTTTETLAAARALIADRVAASLTTNLGLDARNFGNFAECMGIGVGIGIDCNGIYRSGVRYDFPAFGPVTVAVGYANDDVYDIAAKYKGNLGGITSQLALGYSINTGGDNSGAANFGATEVSTFQLQAGLMDPGTGIFGTFAYQHEEADDGSTGTTQYGGQYQDDTDAWWLKVGVKRAFNSLGDTSFAFNYGLYTDQYGSAVAELGVTGSELQRIGLEVNQYFGSRLIVYGVWDNLEVDADCASNTFARVACGAINSSDDLNMFTTGLTFFF